MVRVISDDDTALNAGASLFALAEAGIETAVDGAVELKGRSGRTESVSRHMHNKFAVIDGRPAAHRQLQL